MSFKRLYLLKQQYIYNLNYVIEKTYYASFWYQFYRPTSKKIFMPDNWISENSYRKQQY